MQENGVENVVEGIQANTLNQAPGQTMVVNGQEKTVQTQNQTKKKKCAC